MAQHTKKNFLNKLPFSLVFYMKLVKDGPGCYTLQKNNVAEDFIVKLPQLSTNRKVDSFYTR